MAITNKSIADALHSLFPSKRYAPSKSDETFDTGCPTPPEGWDSDETEDVK